MSKDLSIQDYIALNNLVFNWAESYDTQDWARLKGLLGPSIRLDFRALHGALHEAITPDEYIAIHADPKVIGDPRVKTQHLVGASHWTVDEKDQDVVHAAHQLQVKHQRYADETFKEVVNKGHAHGVVEHVYRRFGAAWKLVGNKPNVGWSEYDLFGTMNPDAVQKGK